MSFFENYVKVKEEYQLSKQEGLLLLHEAIQYSMQAAKFLIDKELDATQLNIAYEYTNAPTLSQLAQRIKNRPGDEAKNNLTSASETEAQGIIPPLEITITQYRNVDVVKVRGSIISNNVSQLAEEFNRITESGRYRIALDMSELEYLSTDGLRVLINTQKACKIYNRGELVLVNIPESIYSNLDQAGFIILFKVFDNVKTAITSI